jgi:diguanylate cyclase (GGDEF)-like protein
VSAFVAVARRLVGCVRSWDLVGRLGGDELLAVCPHVPTVAGAAKIAERCAAALSGQVTVEDQQVGMRASIGVAWTDRPINSADAIVRQADAAMYRSKANNGQPAVVTATT